MQLPIVGARFRPPAQEVLDNLPTDAKLLLRRQPDNPYDGNAVQVLMSQDKENYNEGIMQILANKDVDLPLHLGFIPREAAAELAPLMDTHDAMTGGEGSTSSNAEWPATLTFSASGGPMVSFEAPETKGD